MTSPGSSAAGASARRPRILLAAAAAIGLVLATLGILEPGPRGNPPALNEVVATVNGTAIRAADFERAVNALARDRRNPINDAERRHVLNRIIEEELLVQRAKELELDRHDPRIRRLLVSGMIDSIVADAGTFETSREALHAFYRDNGDFFARTGRLWVRQVRVAVNQDRTDAAALERARTAATRLGNGEPIDIVARELGDPPVAPLPDGPLPAAKLREYLGPTPALKAFDLAAGQVSDPVRGGSAYHVLQMVQRQPEHVPPFDDIESEVRAEMQRRAGDQALCTYLDDLRERADVWIREPNP